MRCLHPHPTYRDDVYARTRGVPSNRQFKYSTWQEAANVYRQWYDNDLLQAIPIPGGPFDKEASKAASAPDANTSYRAVVDDNEFVDEDFADLWDEHAEKLFQSLSI